MTVEEAPVHQHDHPMSKQDDVRLFWQDSDVEPEAMTKCVRLASEPEFWASVLATNSALDARPRRL